MDSVNLKTFFLCDILFDDLYSLVEIHKLMPTEKAQEHNSVPTYGTKEFGRTSAGWDVM